MNYINIAKRKDDNMVNQNQRMDQPPGVLTTKDLAYLEDALSWELIAMKKCNFYAQQTNNIKVKEALDGAGQMHHKHYQMLLGHLDSSKSIQ
ncbi:MAG: hypothetical protein ACOCQ5_00760 [Halanaerobiales bacterium]